MRVSLAVPCLTAVCNSDEPSDNRASRPILTAQRKAAVVLSFGFATLLLSAPSTAGAQESGGNRYLGSATCASSNCHGSATPRTATNVRQNEYTTWYKNEAHAQAYKVLSNKDSKLIGKHLGINNPAEEPLCLKCHSTYVPTSLRGPKFRLSDGVGCESCHGAAEKYIQPHTAKDSTHAGNVKLGMLDMVSLSERAKVCMECHYGTDDQTVNHRLIGAGHPRLTFELDTYGVLQPNHWEIDKDYVERKGSYNSARAWFAGQVARSVEIVKQLRSNKRSKFGAMPELTNFNCYQCHHSLQEEQWKSRSYGGHPGELKLNLSSLEMVAEGLAVIEPSLAGSFKDKLRSLHAAYTDGRAEPVLQDLQSQLTGPIQNAVTGASYKNTNAASLIKQLARYGANNSFLPYETAEQIAMGISALSATADPSGKQYQKKIDSMYDALKNEKSFQPGAFSKAVGALQ